MERERRGRVGRGTVTLLRSVPQPHLKDGTAYRPIRPTFHGPEQVTLALRPTSASYESTG